MAYPSYNAGAYPQAAAASTQGIRNLFKKAYVEFVRNKIQQEFSDLQDTCGREELRGDPLYLDAYKKISLTTRAIKQQYGAYTTGGDKLYSHTQTERRILKPSFFEFAEVFDPRHEKAWMRAVSPDSSYTRNVMAAFNRKKDETIALAYDSAVTLEGEKVTGTAAVNATTSEKTIYLGDARLAAAGGVTTGGKLDLGSLILASRLLNQEGHRGRRFAAVHPLGLEMLLADTNITSADYNSIRLLMRGEIDSFMGFEWRISPEVPTITVQPLSGSTTTDQETGYGAYFYTEDAMVFGMTNDVRIRFDEIPSRGYALQAYHEFGVGAVRMDENAIVRVMHVD
jgi:hypothetical protein